MSQSMSCCYAAELRGARVEGAVAVGPRWLEPAARKTKQQQQQQEEG
jgi:hypothetical protein